MSSAWLLTVFIIFGLTITAHAAPRVIADGTSVVAKSVGITIAKKKKKRKKKSGRERIITRQKSYSRSKTNIDLDSVDISGRTRAPMGSLVKRSRADNDFNFIRIRKRWHPEMIQSASGLDTKFK